jgi:glycosyltransferase involved in cell wall biosynthesis
MRIAQVAPLFESVPPRLYGGTERVVSWLTEELVGQGHEVTLFASGDSVTSAELVPVTPRALRLDPGVVDPIAHHVLMLELVFQRAELYDVVHFHCDLLHLSLARRLQVPHVTTLHGRLDLPDLPAVYREFHDLPLVSISRAQRAPLSMAGWVGTVHHGLPRRLYDPGRGDGGYFVFLGRLSPEKRPDRAIEIAQRTGVPLKIAAKVDRADQAYFDSAILPLLDDPLVEYLGELDDACKRALVCGARALLFPIDWPEPFGLVMIEAMACGTPVVAFRNGSVPEVVDDGLTGLIVEDMDEAVRAAERIGGLDRARCRMVFEERFTVDKMARAYLDVYARLENRPSTGLGRARSAAAA